MGSRLCLRVVRWVFFVLFVAVGGVEGSKRTNVPPGKAAWPASMDTQLTSDPLPNMT